MKLNYLVILRILLITAMIAFTFNYFNNDGINILGGKKKFLKASDSLINSLKIERLQKISPSDSSNLGPNKENSSKEKISDKDLIQSIEKTTNESQNDEDFFESTEPQTIELEQAYKLFSENLLFVDARNKSDYDYSHIKNAINLPLYQFEEYYNTLAGTDKNQPFVVYCNGPDCDMSDILAKKLFDLGYGKIFIFVGGWEEWEKAKYPSEQVH